MLVLSRHKDESIMIGSEVVVTVLVIRDEKAQLNIEAPVELADAQPTLRRNQSVKIGSEIVVTIIDIRGDKIRLGIEAPMSMSVHRKEIYEAIQREKARANAGE